MSLQKKLPLNKRLANLTEILIAFASSPVPSHFFQTLADYTHTAIHYDFLGIALIDPQESAYVIHPLDSKVDISNYLFEPLALKKGLVGKVIDSGRLLRKDKDTSTGHTTEIGEFGGICRQYKLVNQLIVPLMQGTRKIGAILLAADEKNRYNEEDEQVGILLSAGLSGNLEMSRLYQTLSDERSTLSSLLESTQDGFFVISPDGMILIANPAFLDMFGLDQPIIGRTLYQAFPDGPVPTLFKDEDKSKMELKLQDGRIVRANRHPVRSNFGEHLGWAVVFNDITLLKELVSMKTDFVNTVAHDLKNPLASIRMAADLIPKLGETNSAQKDMHERIVRTSSYMKELVTELLDIGQLESNLGLKIKSFDVATELWDVLFALRLGADEKQITIKSELPESLQIEGDSGRLRQLFLNLIGNAIKYTPENGTVAVTLSQPDRHQFKLVVADDGLGIPASDLPHIFEKFYRVKTENRAKIKGTGLGLAITKSIVDAHKGEIVVESEELKGTVFTVTLPISQPEA